MKTLLSILGAVMMFVGIVGSSWLYGHRHEWMVWLVEHGIRHHDLLWAPWWSGFAASGLALVVLALTSSGDGFTKQDITPSTSHGSAREATTAEICPKPNSRREGIVLGMEAEADVETQESPDGSPIWLVHNPRPFVCSLKQHVLIEGPTGFGKDVSVVIPTLLNDVKRSFVVLDPKGETYKLTAGFRNRYQRNVRFAPCSDDSAGFNPLLEVQMGTRHAVKSAKRIANVLAGSAAKEEMSSRIYLKSCETLITAAILHVMSAEPRSEQNLPGVLRLLTSIPDQEAIADRITANPPKGTEMAMNALRTLAEDSRMLKGAFTTAMDVLDFCTMDDVADAISRSDFRPDDIGNGKDPMTVYLEFPFSDADILRPLARLMLNILLSGHRKDRKRDTCYLLNELPSLGNIAAISRGIGELREFGVQFAIFIQSFGQLEGHYGKEDARTIVDNCPVRATLGVAGQKAAEDVSARLGKATLVQARQTEAISQKSWLEQTRTKTRGEGANARELRTADEFRSQESELVLIEFPNKRPYFAKRACSYSDPRLDPLTRLAPPESRRLRLVGGSHAS